MRQHVGDRRRLDAAQVAQTVAIAVSQAGPNIVRRFVPQACVFLLRQAVKAGSAKKLGARLSPLGCDVPSRHATWLPASVRMPRRSSSCRMGATGTQGEL